MQLDSFSQAIFNLIFIFLLSFLMASVIVGCLLSIFLAIGFWRKSRARHEKALDTSLLEVSLPRENEIKIDAAEQLFSGLTSISGTKGMFGFLKVPDIISFEIVEKPQDIRFYVGVPK